MVEGNCASCGGILQEEHHLDLCRTCASVVAPNIVCSGCGKYLPANFRGGRALSALCAGCTSAPKHSMFEAVEPPQAQEIEADGAYRRAARLAIEGAWYGLLRTMDILGEQVTRIPGRVRAGTRVFELPGNLKLIVDPSTLKVRLMDKHQAPPAMNVLANLLITDWSSPKLLLRTVRRMEAAKHWVESIMAARAREWRKHLEDPGVKQIVEQIVGKAVVESLRREKVES